jgi:proteasome lid subunit RPN8/RPN11
MSLLNDNLKQAILAHAASEYPRECCGLLVLVNRRAIYQPCTNLAVSNAQFELDARDYAAAEDKGEILAIVHSHPNASAAPSIADQAMIERTQLPWIIVGINAHDSEHVPTWSETPPSGYHAPYIGRPFAWGIHDCYGLVRDYYQRELNIALPDFARPPEFWLHGLDLFGRHFIEAGFTKVHAEPQRHDMLVFCMQPSRSIIDNHCAIYLGGSLMLHHMMSSGAVPRLSSRDVYAGSWLSQTTAILRHKTLC